MLHQRSLFTRLVLIFLASAPGLSAAEDWQPIQPSDLAFSAEPLAPGAPAIYLYRQVDRDDSMHVERVYERVKVLTDAGRDRANVELRYDNRSENMAFIKARVIHPDGSIINFDGKIDDKSLVAVGGENLKAKTFTLPMVTVGSILELRYTKQLDDRFIYDSHWILNADLFTRTAKFSLRPAEDFTVTYSWPRGLPPDTKGPTKEAAKVSLETHNVPAFASEEFMPPENELKTRVDFVYSSDDFGTLNPDDYWKHYGKLDFHAVDRFMDEPRAMARAVAQIVAPGDDADTKVKKLYARVLQVRNLGSESNLTEQEQAKFKKNSDVEDVWDHGYGEGNQLTLLYAALLRAAGIKADIIYVSSRNYYFFNHSILNSNLLNDYVVATPFANKETFLDPGVPYTHFGLLPWSESGVEGLRLDKDGGTWLRTPLTSSWASRIERRATLQLQPDGTLSGKLQVTYIGLDASWRRNSEQRADAQERAKFLEDEVRESVPVGVDLTLTNQPDWDGSEQPLLAEFEISVPGWAQHAGRRMLLPLGLFNGADRHVFEHEQREHAIYFRYLNQRIDNLDISLPAGYQIGTLPPAHDSNLNTMAYHIEVDQDGSTVQVRRSLIKNAIIVPVATYPAVRNFFQSVRAGDEQQLVLDFAPSQPSH